MTSTYDWDDHMRHEFKNLSTIKIVIFNGKPTHDSFHGDDSGALYHHWCKIQSAFDPIYKDWISFTRILKITKVYKLKNTDNYQ